MHSAGWVEVDGQDVYVEISGEGPTVLCVHTAGQSGVQYRDVLDELPLHGYRVIVPDLPGHGRSGPAVGGPVKDLHQYANTCWSLLRTLEMERPFVVGCSIGGKITLDLCAQHGDELAGGVAMEADAYNGRLSVSGLQRAAQDPASPSQGDRTYFGTLASLGTSVVRERAERSAQMHRREDNLVTTNDLIGWTTHDLRGDLSATSCPVLIVAGADDFWIDLSWARQSAQMMPLGEFRELPGVGHYPMEEIDGFSGLLAQWLRELSNRDPRSGK